MNGKGRGPMKGYNQQKYAENYDQIFRTMKTNQEDKLMTPDQPAATATPRTIEQAAQECAEKFLAPSHFREHHAIPLIAAAMREVCEPYLSHEKCNTCGHSWDPSLVEAGECIFCTQKATAKEREQLRAALDAAKGRP